MFDRLPHTHRTSRLVLRPLASRDGASVVEHMSDFETARMLARVPSPYTLEDFDQFLAYTQTGEEQVWAITHATGCALLGCIGLLPMKGGAVRVGFWLGAPHRRQGIMKETLTAVLEIAFKQGAEKVYAGYFDDNHPSRDLQLSFGFVPGARALEFCMATGKKRPHTDTFLCAGKFESCYPDG